MTKPDPRRVTRVEQWLVASHQERPPLALPPGWRENLLRDIRLALADQGAPSHRERLLASFTDDLMRLAGAGALASLAALTFALFYGRDLAMQAANLAVDFPWAVLPLERLLGS
ncbi:MAG: hypothetical protein KQJ78_00655 [Deltaproteobacteria bacterium]|nr:hypothetical protein [Deltaproteobacteria bacterium]